MIAAAEPTALTGGRECPNVTSVQTTERLFDA